MVKSRSVINAVRVRFNSPVVHAEGLGNSWDATTMSPMMCRPSGTTADCARMRSPIRVCEPVVVPVEFAGLLVENREANSKKWPLSSIAGEMPSNCYSMHLPGHNLGSASSIDEWGPQAAFWLRNAFRSSRESVVGSQKGFGVEKTFLRVFQASISRRMGLQRAPFARFKVACLLRNAFGCQRGLLAYSETGFAASASHLATPKPPFQPAGFLSCSESRFAGRRAF